VRTVAVDAGTIGTTQFNLTEDDQKFLLKSGRDAAGRFLDRFDLAGYENTFHLSFVDTETVADKPSSAASLTGPAAGPA
jgi:hypothetical protein